ncbi:hypothetical protein MFUM_1020066 [Methylacidiphilum fumariolicum SolV]|uniref:Uncharacterized protein n=2 Tax=Candidatus Methylacidiphilum fumarolicum TaxID=591154 RepID=I0JVS3_METFB|nr:conserved protein of unknown function [Candidatus Methylacidiphilum fumarolicum]CCG91342.1 hypothetical protein MFUM_1020066 [Methylacidiphilum fumariolicum SolV]
MEMEEWGEISDGHGGSQGPASLVRFRVVPRSFAYLMEPISPS